MRLASATAWLMLGLATAACQSTPAPSDDDITARFATLGVEGQAYVHDLGETSSIHVHAVHGNEKGTVLVDQPAHEVGMRHCGHGGPGSRHR